jgi:hypothetical protein
MTNVLIRDLEPQDVARLDAHAAALGLSHNEYLRRRLQQDARRGAGSVTQADFKRIAERFSDLADEELNEASLEVTEKSGLPISRR